MPDIRRHALRILLLQIRETENVAREELESFSRFAELPLNQIDVLNVFTTPKFDHDVIDGYDALWVGGASEANVLHPERYPFIADAQALLRYCCERKIPVFASCFGFQLAVLALGGDIVDSDGAFEMGCIPIKLTEAAQNDTLMNDTPDGFMAVSVHRQKALTLPADCELLACTDICCHAFKVKDKPFWAFQFHPEVDRKTLVERLTVYQHHYTSGSEQLDGVLSNAVETPESNVLVKKFVDRVLCARHSSVDRPEPYAHFGD